MRIKVFVFISFLTFFSSLSFCYIVTWYDEDGYEIKKPKENENAAYWMEAMNKSLSDSVIRCLPKEWKKVKEDYETNKEIQIMISDKFLDDLEKGDKEVTGEDVCVCGGHVDGMMFFRTKATYQKKNNCCYCPEATALHELIHLATGINDDYDIDACVNVALKKAGIGNCINNLPKPKCKCKDHKGNKPTSDCKW